MQQLTQEIIGAAFEVRKHLGRFLYEEVYETALQHELKIRNIRSERQVYLPVKYKDICLEKSYRIDLLIENKIIVELKAVEIMGNNEVRQILSYLKFSGMKIGYLMNFGANDFSIGTNFNESKLEKGIYRFVL